ncbi:hypothetical protein J4456_02045 [Candidatus Pacearchaeota archaeon]|nr:hypothetical protein [Candidatus Pacearchaeota archaeon]
MAQATKKYYTFAPKTDVYKYFSPSRINKSSFTLIEENYNADGAWQRILFHDMGANYTVRVTKFEGFVDIICLPNKQNEAKISSEQLIKAQLTFFGGSVENGC